ncbi:MAG: biopolymer transporter ExbD [Planctomycetes bacterium]|nr:biopolymer transporter ExbD [Planctomycetota bacterium]
MKFRRKKAPPARFLEITALIDVMFILNIFFMLNSQFSAPSGIGINLPQAKSGESILIQSIEINVNDLDQVLVEDEEVTLSELTVYLQAQNKETPIVIRADRESSYGKALKIFDLLRSLSYTSVTLATVPERM